MVYRRSVPIDATLVFPSVIALVHIIPMSQAVTQLRGSKSSHIRYSKKYIRLTTIPMASIMVVILTSSKTLIPLRSTSVLVSTSNMILVTIGDQSAHLVQGNALVDMIEPVLYRPTPIIIITLLQPWLSLRGDKLCCSRATDDMRYRHVVRE